jgi:SAM-dependent methyltransferase
MNFFAYPTAGERYAKGRPYFHPLVMEKIRATCALGDGCESALDVGCGTGQSAIALADIAKSVVGVDVSAAMLAQAAPHARIKFICASAEQIPLPDSGFDLITVALAFHWLDRKRFMAESRRLLKDCGWLVIYNDMFLGRIKVNPKFEHWNREGYLARYPTPPRSYQPPTDAEAIGFGFEPVSFEKFEHEVTFTPQMLVNYLLTQSNVIAAVEQGTQNVQEIAQWLLESVTPLFEGETCNFPFRCEIRVLRRVGDV